MERRLITAAAVAVTFLNFLNGALVKAVIPPSGYLPQAWEYGHSPLAAQLDAGVRAFEIDVHPDPLGGLYSTPGMLKFAGTDPNLNDPSMLKPGFKVLHVPDIDFATSCTTLVSCLTTIKNWSAAHPTHVPITILLETSFGETDLVTMLGSVGTNLVNNQLNASTLPGPKALVTQPPASPELLSALESEILSVFPLSSVITPDSVRAALGLAASANLTQALLKTPTATSCPWPDFETLRGKVMFGFIMHERATIDMYKAMHPNQAGAVGWLVWDSYFVQDAVMYSSGNFDISVKGGVVPPSIPSNASAIVDALAKEIALRAKAGYLVRGRADVDTVEARAGYMGRVQALYNSPATIIATDYPLPAAGIPGMNYRVQLPGGQPARCVNGAAPGYSGPEVSCSAIDTVTALPLGPDATATTAPAMEGSNTGALSPNAVPAAEAEAEQETPSPSKDQGVESALPPLAGLSAAAGRNLNIFGMLSGVASASVMLLS